MKGDMWATEGGVMEGTWHGWITVRGRRSEWPEMEVKVCGAGIKWDLRVRIDL